MKYKTMRFAAVLAAAVAMSGCKEILYSSLTEREANEMVAVLHQADISVSRKRGKDNVYALSVDSAQVPEAISILIERGLPRDRFQSLGDVFGADSILGTPFEQQAQMIHALNQELSNTISTISGVRHARVMLAIPQPNRFEREVRMSSASVTIEHEAFVSSNDLLPKIKLIVANAVPNLDYEDVVVVMFPHMPLRQPTPAQEEEAEGPVVLQSGISSAAALLPSAIETGSMRDTIKLVLLMSVITALVYLLTRTLTAPLRPRTELKPSADPTGRTS